jgi:predicted Rossmann fold nucleotide-binding protein DprA/Smf involved in DNA uptake
MTTVFISGSRKIGNLNQTIRDRLQNVLDQRFAIVVGDANGADKAVQAYLMERQYQQVTVYCSGDICRNNVGRWHVSNTVVDHRLKGRDFYTQKDKQMAAVADYGFVLWDGESPGSYNNVMELLKNNKKALVYFVPERVFFTVSRLEDAQGLLNKCSLASQDRIKKKIRLPALVKEIETMAQGSLPLI